MRQTAAADALEARAGNSLQGGLRDGTFNRWIWAEAREGVRPGYSGDTRQIQASERASSEYRGLFDGGLPAMIDLDELYFWIPALMLGYYLAVPLLVGLQQRFPASPTFTELNFEGLDPSLAGFLMTRTRTLYDLGFSEPTLVQIPDAAPRVTSYLIMLVNRQSGDKAMVTVLIGRAPVPIQSLYVEFSTRFDTGEVFDTHNSRTLPAFPPVPMAVRTQVPSVEDLRELYQLHTFVMDKHAVRGKKVLYDPGQALDYLHRFAFLKSYEDRVKSGWLYYDQGSDSYRPTFTGMYGLVWGLQQPFKKLRTLALHRRARKILEEFHQACAAMRGE